MSYILMVGANSDIAKEIARVYAKNGYNLCLTARNPLDLKELAADIKIRFNVDVDVKKLDICDFASHKEFYDKLEEKPLGVIVVSGYMNAQKITQDNWDECINTINVNYTGAVSFLNIVANDFEKEQRGFIVGISSVAGDRGRKTNYIYGSAKAGFSVYLSGLRNRLYESGIQVLTVKPGFVATKMTEGLNLPEKLTAQPKDVANDIFNAQQKGKDILYTKWIWKYIMFIIKHIPEFIFKKLSI